MILYEVKCPDGVCLQEFSFEEYMQVFREGCWVGLPVEWIQPQHQVDKRVTFAENVNG